MALKSGDQFRNYKIVRELGRGRFGITYLAKDQNNQNCVVKTLSDDLIEELRTDPKELRRLEDKIWQEGVRLAKCQHPHIVKIIDSFRGEDGRPYLIEEFIAGDNLEDLPNQILSESEALNYIRQVGEALICVHQHNLVHRDVKPANIMIRAGKSEAVLIDFGLAKGFDNFITTVKASTADGFAPIELYDPNNKHGPYTDVYSLAATLYVLLTRTLPPKAKDRSPEMPPEFRKELIAPKKLNPALSDRTNDAIIKGLAFLATERPQNMEEWLKLLSIRSYPNFSTLVKDTSFWGIVAGITGIAAVLVGIIGVIGTWIPLLKNNTPSPDVNSAPVQEKQNK